MGWHSPSHARRILPSPSGAAVSRWSGGPWRHQITREAGHLCVETARVRFPSDPGRLWLLCIDNDLRSGRVDIQLGSSVRTATLGSQSLPSLDRATHRLPTPLFGTPPGRAQARSWRDPPPSTQNVHPRRHLLGSPARRVCVCRVWHTHTWRRAGQTVAVGGARARLRPLVFRPGPRTPRYNAKVCVS